MRSERLTPSLQPLCLSVLDREVRIECPDSGLRQLLCANFGAMATACSRAPDLFYSIRADRASSAFSLERRGMARLEASDPGDLLFLLEKDLTVELQKRRPELLFLHSAAVEWNGQACLLAAESGCGKSTTAWALLHHRFSYLTDEFSPIDLRSMRVFPYPHALCLKEAPPAYPLPADTIHLGRTSHVPAKSLPSSVVQTPCALGAVFIVQYVPELTAPSVRPIGSAEASARLYLATLNALAHSNCGLDAVTRIAEHSPCFFVSSNELGSTCSSICAVIEGVMGTRKASLSSA
jgi:hypothetical protein